MSRTEAWVRFLSWVGIACLFVRITWEVETEYLGRYGLLPAKELMISVLLRTLAVAAVLACFRYLLSLPVWSFPVAILTILSLRSVCPDAWGLVSHPSAMALFVVMFYVVLLSRPMARRVTQRFCPLCKSQLNIQQSPGFALLGKIGATCQACDQRVEVRW